MYTVHFIPLQTQHFFKAVKTFFHSSLSSKCFPAYVFQILDSKNIPQKNMFTFDNLKASTSAQRTLQRALTTFGYV